MSKKNLTQIEIKKIIKDEVKNYISKELENEIKKELTKSNSTSRKEIIDIIKKALTSLFKFLYIRNTVWTNDIK